MLYLDWTNTNSLKVSSVVSGCSRWEMKKRKMKKVCQWCWCWCWCWCNWRWGRPGGSLKMFQVSVTHLWITAKVLQKPGDWRQSWSCPFQPSFQLKVSLSVLILIHLHHVQGKLVGRFPLPFLILPIIITAACCYGFQMWIITILETGYDLIKISVSGTQRQVWGRRRLLQS